MKKFVDEREGQIAFFKNFHIDYENNDVLIKNTDGVWKGNLFEFKPIINDVNSVLFQAIKYASKLRISGISVPANILLVSINDTTLYYFKSKDYYEEIHKVYVGAASRNNEGFVAKDYVAKYDYSKDVDALKVLDILKSTDYMPIDINEDCIVGWATRYYKEHPTATKGDFLGSDEGLIPIVGEIREPRYFKGLINSYTKPTNEKFKYLMDALNDRLKKKNLGAFYTPIAYCEKAAELVRKAISRVPKGNDYIILDRCAGTGNLESVLTDEELSHCVLSTYEYYEYKVLLERLADKVRAIVPPTESHVKYGEGYVLNADALSKDYIENEIIKEYVEDPKCTIILYENPPYRDDTSGMTKINSKQNSSYVLDEMRKENVEKVNELANRFIWSGFKYYLRKPTDSYILFSPIKYWKWDHLIDKKINSGFIFNKKFFHASSASAISCILWENEDEKLDKLNLDVYDLDNEENINYVTNLEIKRSYNEITKLFIRQKDKKDKYCNIFCQGNGNYVLKEGKSLINSNILGYIVARGFGISNPNLNFNLLRMTYSDSHGFHIRENNYYSYMIFLSIKHYLMFCRPWYEVELVGCSSDKMFEYQNDSELLKSCFIFGCLDYYNKCLSFNCNGKLFINELCFEKGTIAYKKLKSLSLTKKEEELISLYNKIIKLSKQTKNYNSKYKYGLYQICLELNTFVKDENDNTIYDYPELNGHIKSLRSKLNEYFDENICEKLFKYEILK